MSPGTISILILAESGSAIGSMFFWLLIVFAVAGAMFWVVSWIRKRWVTDDEAAAPIGFTLSDLRQLHKSGQLSTEEYERARANMVEATKAAQARREAEAAEKAEGSGKSREFP